MNLSSPADRYLTGGSDSKNFFNYSVHKKSFKPPPWKFMNIMDQETWKRKETIAPEMERDKINRNIP